MTCVCAEPADTSRRRMAYAAWAAMGDRSSNPAIVVQKCALFRGSGLPLGGSKCEGIEGQNKILSTTL